VVTIFIYHGSSAITNNINNIIITIINLAIILQ